MTENKFTNEEIKIIYILGSGRSGSTFLDLLLGAHPEIFSLGEICNLPAIMNLNWKCGCGLNLSNCNFWKSVFSGLDTERVEKMKFMTSLTPAKSKIEKIFQLLNPEITNAIDKFHAQIDCTLFHEILNKTSSKWLVDSSKDFNRLLYLRNIKKLRIKIVYLFKDVRGYANSVKKPPRLETLNKKNRNGTPVWKSSLRWLIINSICLYILFRIPEDNRIFVRYEDLASNPERELKRICRYLNLSFRNEMLEFSDKPYHIIGGNRMRFRKNQVIKLDEKWHQELTYKEKKVCSLIAGVLNKVLMKKSSYSSC